LVGCHLTLGLLQFGRSGKGFRDRFSFHFAGEAKVRAMRGLVGLMAVAVGLAAGAISGGDRTAAELGQFRHALKGGAALLFQIGEGLWHVIPS